MRYPMNQQVQAFPKNGLLAKNLNRTYSELAEQIGKANGAAYSYIVTSVWMDDSGQRFEQYGSGPNFQGGRLTCTCMHQMRRNRSSWGGMWVAGFTSRCRYR